MEEESTSRIYIVAEGGFRRKQSGTCTRYEPFSNDYLWHWPRGVRTSFPRYTLQQLPRANLISTALVLYQHP